MRFDLGTSLVTTEDLEMEFQEFKARAQVIVTATTGYSRRHIEPATTGCSRRKVEPATTGCSRRQVEPATTGCSRSTYMFLFLMFLTYTVALHCTVVSNHVPSHSMFIMQSASSHRLHVSTYIHTCTLVQVQVSD